MKNIVVVWLFLSVTLLADTVGINMQDKQWVDAPVVSSTLEPAIKEQPVQTNQQETSVVVNEQNKMREIEKKVGDFFLPLWQFIENNSLLFISFLTFFTLLLYTIFYLPLQRRLAKLHDEEIDIPRTMHVQKSTNAVIKEVGILSQNHYATLYGLINEHFLYEKEQVMLDKNLSTESKNRDVMALEWKFNQILHFSLPKLSTNNAQRFKEGVSELLKEEISRDIMIVMLEDLLLEKHLDSQTKEMLRSLLDSHKKELISSTKKPANNNHTVSKKGIYYTNYMVQ